MRTYRVTLGGEAFDVGIDPEGRPSIGGVPVMADIRQIAPAKYSVLLDGHSLTLMVSESDGTYRVAAGTLEYEVGVENERQLLMRKFARPHASGSRKTEVRAPMPALVVRLEVSEGTKVDAGSGLIVLEAMKMENELKAHAPGTVTSIRVTRGKAVDKGELLMVLE